MFGPPPPPVLARAWAGPMDGLTHRWSLRDEGQFGAIAYDTAGGHTAPLHGTIVGGVSSTEGPQNKRTARRLAGTGWLTLASTPVTIANAHSAFLWAWLDNIANAGSGGSSQTFFAFAGGGNTVRMSADELSPGGFLHVSIYIGAAETSARNASLAQFVNNKWAHVGYTWSGSAITLYADGKVFSNEGWAGFGQPSASFIGARSATLGAVTGKIANAVTYSRALTAPEVEQLYLAGA
jgi:hypothetical protein